MCSSVDDSGNKMVRLVEAVQFLCSNLPVSEEIKLSALILTTTLPNDALLVRK
jgi:hypothetical protein